MTARELEESLTKLPEHVKDLEIVAAKNLGFATEKIESFGPEVKILPAHGRFGRKVALEL